MPSPATAFNKLVVNSLIVIVVFVFAFFVATQALMHKINNYELNKSLLFLEVEKESFEIVATVAGRVDEVLVRDGAAVKAGDIVARLKDEGRDFKIAALREVARDNLSARTELQLLLSQESEYTLRAARSGIVERVHATKGTSIIEGTSVMTIFADDGLELVGTIRPEQYQLIDKHRDVSVFSPRLGQAFTASFLSVQGVREDTLSDTVRASLGIDTNNVNDELYEIHFILNETEEGSSLVDGERLELLSDEVAVEQPKPLYRLARLWNSLILGTDFDSLKRYHDEQNTNQSVDAQ